MVAVILLAKLAAQVEPVAAKAEPQIARAEWVVAELQRVRSLGVASQSIEFPMQPQRRPTRHACTRH